MKACLRLPVFLGTGLLLAGTAAAPAASGVGGPSARSGRPAAVLGAPDAVLPTEQRIRLVLGRLAFGASLQDLASVRAVGVDRWISQQLDPESVPEAPELAGRLQALSTQPLTPAQLFQAYGPPGPEPGQKRDPEQVKARRVAARIIVQQAADARLLRATLSTRQLQEVLVAFWFDHFNVFAQKGLDHLWVGNFEDEAIRPHVLGKFRDLLQATATHPAMLFYLDNWQNTAPGSVGARGRQEGLNENYAREVMELHTLGVGNGYTQDDVIQLARILTGWGITPSQEQRQAFLRQARFGGGPDPERVVAGPALGRAFFFDPDRHDPADKLFLGRAIRGEAGPAGQREGEEALDMLARSPATARHLSFELAQYFVADQPDPALVNAMAARYLATDGDLRQVLKALFGSRQFWASSGQKYKTPYQFVVSAVRASGLALVNTRPMLAAMAQMGQPLYACLTPDGWKNTEEAWLNPDATTKRVDFAAQLGRGQLRIDRAPIEPPPPDGVGVQGRPGQTPPRAMTLEALMGQSGRPAPAGSQPAGVPLRPLDPNAIEAVLGALISPRTAQLVQAAPQDLQAAMLLGSPDFMRR